MRRAVVTVLVLLGVLISWRVWVMAGEREVVERSQMYARAIDVVVAAHAIDATARRFFIDWPITTPEAERPPELAAAFDRQAGGSAPVTAPCPLEAVDMNEAGPGRCWLAFGNYGPGPGVCTFAPCVVVNLPADLLADPDLRRDLRPGSLRRVACALRSTDPTAAPVRDCGALGFFAGPVFIAAQNKKGERISYVRVG
jgi:hypothetical protein